MITIDSIKNLYLDNYLIQTNGQCFYGYLKAQKSDLTKLGLNLKKGNNKYLLSLGASNADLIIIPFDNLNQEFNLEKKIIFPLSKVTQVVLKSHFKGYSLRIYEENNLLVTMVFSRKDFHNQEFKRNVLAFLNRFQKPENSQKEASQTKIAKKENQAPNTFKPTPKINLNSNFSFVARVIPYSLLENPEDSQNLVLSSFLAKVVGDEEKLLIINNQKEIFLDYKRISEIIVRKSYDAQNVELWVRNRNENLVKFVFSYADINNQNIKNNIDNFVNRFIHTGEGLDHIILKKKEEKKASWSQVIFLLIILSGIIIGIYLFLN